MTAHETTLADDASARWRERIGDIVENIADGFAVLDRDWRFVYMNRRGEQIILPLGKDRSALYGKSLWEEFPHLRDTPNEAHYRRAMREMVTVEFELYYPPLRRWFEVRAYPFADGLAIYYLDITARRQAEDALASEKKVLEEIAGGLALERVLDTLARQTEAQSMDGMLCSVLLLDEAGERLLHGAAPSLPQAYNDAIHGIAIGPRVGSCGTAAHRRAPVFVTDIANDPLWADFRDLALSHGLRACCSTPIIGSQGALLGTIAMYYPMPHDPDTRDRQLIGLATHLAGIAIERKRHEDALRIAERRKDEFLAVLSHELRNPLAPLRLGLEIMRRASGDPAVVTQARDVMERQLTQMVRLVDDLLDLSRISLGRMELRRQPTALRDVVQQALEISRPLIDARGHDIEVALPQESLLLDADGTRLAQVFSNLLNNSAKFTLSPAGRIAVRVERRAERVRISVADNGMGIPAARLRDVFEPFAAFDESLNPAQRGLGIGLALARRLVELHGGSIEARSEGAGRGSEFVVDLPLLRHAVPADSDAERTAPAGVQPRRILVVDDHEDAAFAMSLMLKMMGNDTRIARTGSDALQLGESFRPSVILLDVGMPNLNGYETARLIRRQEWGKDVVLAAVTGFGQEADKRRAAEAGFDHHFVKPVEPALLQKMLG